MATEDEHTALITSNGEQGLVFGVYKLLEKLGCGFYLSFENLPETKDEFDFSEWNLSDQPLVKVRFVFNWHNFMSGCTGWNLPDWKQWIAQSQKMGYNTVMVHAYGNNPMYTFSFNGLSKPVGYLASSIKGRDWSIEHVNDVRRLPGGYLFKNPVFGSEAALVPDDERVNAIQSLMYDAFQSAEERGVKVNFAMDFDILSTIPQDIVMTLPEKDRFRVWHDGIGWMGEKEGWYWLPRPDTEGGYKYYKAQVESLLQMYPQIDIITLWRRAFGSIWVEMKKESMPESWQKEYEKHITQKPQTARYLQSTGSFAQGKLIRAFQKALNDLGKQDINLAIGTWRFNNIASMAEFIPEEIPIIILDSEVVRKRDLIFEKDTVVNMIRKYVQPGRMLPVIWAHHDDGTYIGSPLKNFDKLSERLEKTGSGGFGIIHWMTRPFDAFFVNHIRQTWENTANESLEQTCQHMAQRMFGNENSTLLGNYLLKWYNEMPSFGRETGRWFIDHPLKNINQTVKQCNERIGQLNKVDTTTMTLEQKENLLFSLNYEKWVIGILGTQGKYQQFKELIKEGKESEALNVIKECQPHSVLEQYAKTIQFGEITRGEQGLLFSMGLRWLPYFISARQQVGLEPVRINFGHTSHEPLAQAVGNNTYLIDQKGNFWKTLGSKETNGQIQESTSVEIPDDGEPEIFKEELVVDKKISVDIPMLTKKRAFYSGKYKLKLFCSGNSENQLSISAFSEKTELLLKVVDDEEYSLQYVFELSKRGGIQLEFSVKDNVIINGFELEKL